ncbi:MAG: peptide chain release factor 1 [bacterium]|nr:peptide chain release factor 1 [bacterium]
MFNRLVALCEEYDRLTAEMSTQEVASDPVRYRDLAKAQSAMGDTVRCFRLYQTERERLDEAEEILRDESDAELRELAEEDKNSLSISMDEREQELKVLLIPTDPNDEKNTIMEIRAGTGGEEAALFVGDLYRMYSRFAELKVWKIEIMNSHASDMGGYKEISFRIIGESVFSQLKFEGGVHRVQRVPETESQGRIHTSAVTVAVLPEAEAVDIAIDQNDLQIDVYRSSGPGGQSVNTTDSAVRITHKPTGVVVTCQDEKSQHKNKAKALVVLRARLLARKREEENAARSADRRSQVGSGDRSERIRTYNYPQNRVTDHRINFTIHKLDAAMEGAIQDVIDALTTADRAAKMAHGD